MLKDTSGDFITFLIALGFGIVLSLIYDFIKSIRQTNRHTKATIFVEDIIYSFIAAIVTYLLQFLRVNGEIRWFVLIGELSGFIFSRILLTEYTVKIFKKVNKMIKKIIIYPLKKIFLIISLFLNHTLNDFFENIEFFFKKSLKHICHLVYNKSKSAKQKTEEVN